MHAADTCGLPTSFMPALLNTNIAKFSHPQYVRGNLQSVTVIVQKSVIARCACERGKWRARGREAEREREGQGGGRAVPLSPVSSTVTGVRLCFLLCGCVFDVVYSWVVAGSLLRQKKITSHFSNNRFMGLQLMVQGTRPSQHAVTTCYMG